MASDLVQALARVADGYRDRAPVFHISSQSRDATVREASNLTRLVWNQFGDCSLRVDPDGAVSIARLSNDGSVRIFPSGAIEAAMSPPEARTPMATDERQFDRKKVDTKLREMAQIISRERMAADEELRFESLWEHKAQAVTVKEGQKTPVALLALVGAFRRYVHGLPVLGRASVHVGLCGDLVVNRWGIDWRRRESKPFAETEVISPEDGAKRVLDDLWWRRPERPFTTDDFEPVYFRLGYLAHARRAEQRVMQPAWVAVLKPRTTMSMGHVVAVPATPRAFEPIGRPARMQRIAHTG